MISRIAHETRALEANTPMSVARSITRKIAAAMRKAPAAPKAAASLGVAMPL